MSAIRNILVIKLDHLGDMLWATPALAALKFKFPAAKISVVCTPAAEPILRYNPAVSRIMVYDKSRFAASAAKAAWLRQSVGAVDLAVCLDTRDEAILLARLSNAPIRGGYYYKDRFFSTLKTWWRLSHKFVHPTMGPNPEHEVINNIRLLEKLNLLTLEELPPEILRTRLYLSPAEMAESQQILDSMGLTHTPLIMYNIPNKTINHGWPKEHISQIAERLDQSIPGAAVLVIAGPGEEPLLESIRPSLPPCCRTLSGLSFRVWAGIFTHCRFSVSRDAGAVHVSAAMGVPVISIFEEEWKHMEPCWEAWNVMHQNVVRPEKPTALAIEKHIDDVADAANSLWKKVSNAG